MKPVPRRPDHPSPLTEEKRLADLLALTDAQGPDWLLAQFVTDLGAVQTALRAALPGMDGSAIRGATHVLMSLAGTVGAPRLHAAALALNEAAHRADPDAITHAARPVTADLAALIDDLTARMGA